MLQHFVSSSRYAEAELAYVFMFLAEGVSMSDNGGDQVAGSRIFAEELHCAGLAHGRGHIILARRETTIIAIRPA